jgi:hypothetical protein
MRDLGNRGSRLLAGRVRSTRPTDEWATRFEAGALAAQLRAGLEPLCAHNHVTEAVNRDTTLDNSAVQAAGQVACRAAQRAALAAEAE